LLVVLRFRSSHLNGPRILANFGIGPLVAAEKAKPSQPRSTMKGGDPVRSNQSVALGPAISSTKSTMRRLILASWMRMKALVKESPSEVARNSET